MKSNKYEGVNTVGANYSVGSGGKSEDGLAFFEPCGCRELDRNRRDLYVQHIRHI
jgi:hypothetical protein